MVRIASLLVCAALTVGAVGCYDGGYGRNRGNDPWWNDRDRDSENRDYPDDSRRNRNPDVGDDCRRNRGRVDEGKWRYAVDQFESRSFRKLKGFRAAKSELLDNLLGVRARACDWEQPAVDRLIGRVRDMRFNEATGGVN